MKPNPKLKTSIIAASVLLSSFGALRAADQTDPYALPTWISELSVNARVGFDSNFYGVDNSRSGEPIENHDITVSSVGAKFVFSASQLNGSPKDYLVIGYAPTVTWYGGASSDDNKQHVFTVQSRGQEGNDSWAFNWGTTVIKGSKASPHFNTYNIYGMGLVRDRRSQMVDTGKLWVRRDYTSFFVRGTGSLLINDYRTDLRQATGSDAGWLNWVDRRDINGGLDLGWKLLPETSVFAGYRIGNQRQGATVWSTKYSSNHYSRVLLGIESKPVKKLSLMLVAGPDFRSYSEAGQYVDDRTPLAWYCDGSANLTISPEDSLALALKQERWLSSTGQSAYDSKSVSLAWKHKIAAAWNLQVSVQRQQGKYVAPAVRNDAFTSAAAQLQWDVNKQLALTADLTMQDGVDLVGTSATTGRDFHRNVVGVGAKFAF